MARRPFLARVADALAALSGVADAGAAPLAADEVSADEARAVAGNGLEMLNGSAWQNVSGVRTANPQEYKADGATIRTQGFQKHPVVHACLRVICDQVAQIPLVVRANAEPDAALVGKTHPLQRLLDSPGKRLTARQLRARITMDILGYGNGIVQIERVAPMTGKPLGLRPLNVEGVQTVWVNDDGDAAIWDVSNWNGRVLQIAAEDLIHFRDLDMPRPFAPDVFGYPRGAAAIQSIIADNEATGYVRQTVANDGTPTFITLLESGVTQADALALKQRYEERTVRRGKRGSPEFFAGVRDVKALGFTLSDLEFPDLRRVAREDICAAFGVDPRMIGIASATSDAGLSGAQYAEARSRLVQHTVEPLLGLIVDELNAWLAPEYGRVVIDYDREVLRDLVEDDTATSARIRAEVAVPGLRTLESARKALRIEDPALTDTFVVPLGQQLVPVAAAVIDPTAMSAPPSPTPAEPPPPDGSGDDTDDADDADEEDDDGDVEPEDDESEDESRAIQRRSMPGEDVRRAHWQRQIALLDADEVRYAATARRQFASDATRVARRFEEMAEVSARGVNDPNLERLLADIRAGYAPGGDFHAAWEREFQDLIARTYRMGNAAEVVGTAALDFQLPSAYVQNAVAARAARLATYVGETTAKQITAVVRAAERAGLGVRDTARLIQLAVYGEPVTDARARTIARTESAGAMSQGQWDQARESGVYQSKEWLAFSDDETRETHRACMAQGRIPIDEPFAANRLKFPMEPGAPPGEAINCRCRPIFYVEAANEPLL